MSPLPLLASFLLLPTALQPTPVLIDWTSPGQKIEGFGASSAWYDRALPDFDPDTRQAMVDFLFDPKNGLGLTIHRLRIDPHPGNKPDGPLYDWDHPRIRAQGEALRFIRQRHNPRFIAAPWTPPSWMKSNGQLKEGGRLLEQHYPAYAAYLVAWLQGMKEHFGIHVEILSVQNEPDEAKSWESCVWTPEEMATFIADHLKPALDQAGLQTQLMAAEPTRWDDQALNTILAHPRAGPAISHAAAHLYHGSRLQPKVFQQAVDRNLPVWMTEFYLGDYAMNQPFTEHDRVLALAETMHDTLVLSRANAYLFWWMWAPPDKPAEGLIVAEFGDPFTPPFTVWRKTEKAFGFAHFSRFIRPGAIRLTLNPSRTADDVRLSAYQNPDHSLVFVAINSSANPVPLSLADPSLSDRPHRSAFVTTAHTPLAALPLDQDSSIVTLPARSLATLVFQKP